MSEGDPSDYQLTCAEGHARSRLHSIQVAPDGRTAVFFRWHLHHWNVLDNPSGGQVQY